MSMKEMTTYGLGGGGERERERKGKLEGIAIAWKSMAPASYIVK
jgi:hypothetical protein